METPTAKEALAYVEGLIVKAARAGKKSLAFQTWDYDACKKVESELKAKGFTVELDFKSKVYKPDPLKKGEYLIDGIHYLNIGWQGK
jgi:hypothetical protein